MKCISGIQPLTEGEIAYGPEGRETNVDEIFQHLVVSAPYLELPEEFTLLEFLQFHFRFKSPKSNLDISTMLDIMYLKGHEHKPISQFSSGMKQRLKLGICFFSQTNLILLDEPTSNLDEKGVAWYLQLVQGFSHQATMLICSNDSREFSFCQNRIDIEAFKAKRRL